MVRHLRALRGRWSFFSEPFEIYLALLALVSGPSVLFGLTRPSALASQIAPWMLRAWGAALIIGAVLTLLARWLIAGAATAHGQESAARIEVIAMTIFAGAATMYATSILAIGAVGIPAASFVGGYAAACATRARIITNEWRDVRSARRARGRWRLRDG